ncbi:LOW QUALITY PROTEIN: venom factor-like [Leptodactylus fuscus]
MGCRLLWLTLLCLLVGCFGQPCTLITPSVLRLESEETIVIDGHNKAFEADVEIQDFPKRTLSLTKQKISLNNGNNFLGTAKVTIPSKELAMDPKAKQYVYVTVRSPVCNMEKIVLLSHQSGYIFIQKDKTIYTPGSKVLYNIFFMNYKMSSMNKTVIVEYLNPENVIVKREKVRTEEDSDDPSRNSPPRTSCGHFSVEICQRNNPRCLILPTFDIQLIPEKKYFYVDDPEFSVDIKAKYLYGEPVNGKALVIFGIKTDDGRTSLSNTLRRVSIENGEGRVVLRREDLLKNFRNADEMLQYTLYMSLTIVTDSGEYSGLLAGSEMVESDLEDIYIVRSPYNVLFTKSSNYFKPGMPYDLLVLVTNPDGSPAIRVPVVADPGHEEGITGPEGTARLTLNTAANTNVLQVTVRTSHPDIPPAQQATASMTANAYQSAGNYLHIFITATEIKAGDRISVYFNIRNNNAAVQDQIQHITYLIMNKGKLLKVGKKPRLQGQTLVTMSLPITDEFTPSFRIVGYYIAGNDIVADSVWVDVMDSCMGTLSVTGKTERDNLVQSPGSSMRLQLQADHKAKVALVAVDKGVYGLNSKFKISQKKIRESVEKLDIGCTPGSGADSMGVFYNAGLALQSSFQETQQRSEPQCEVHRTRRRRFSDLLTGQKTIYGGDDDDDYLPDADIVSRLEFPESWFWRVEQMNERPDNKGISTKNLNIFLKDSITTWEVMAVSLSQNKGICVAKPYEIRVMRDFFIDLTLPYSVMRNEQVEIRAVLYNYGHDRIKVRVELTHNPEFCSYSTAKAKYRQVVEIRAQSSVVVPFIIVPLSLGDHAVEVKAAIFRQFVSDGVRKKLKVVPEGVRIAKIIKSVILDPQAKGKDGVQEEIVYPLDEKKIVPRTDIETIVTIQENPQVIQTAADVIDGARLNPLIVVAYGNGEETMMTMTPTLMATMYLDATNQWDSIGVNRRTEALNNIKQGYTRQLSFRKADGSFAAFSSLASSTWLNVYVVRVLAMAQELVAIDNNVLCGAVKWLILEKQISDGSFQENFRIIHSEMMGGMQKSSDYVTLTAFAVIAMLESEKICSPPVHNLKVSIEKATSFLQRHYQGLVKPYTIALTSYALAMAGAIDNPEKLLSGATDKVQWNDPEDRYVTIEATSYALLTLLHFKQYDLTEPIVNWLKEQKFYGAVFSYTQATFVMFHSLAQYKRDVILDMEVSISLAEISSPIIYRINTDNHLLAHSTKTRTNKEFVVRAKGKGQSTLTVTSFYYHLLTVKEKECKNFDLSVRATEQPKAMAPEGVLETVSIEICTRYLKGNDATMPILEISMMTGFIPDIESLNKLNRGADKYISKYEINREGGEKNSLVIYLDKISHKQDECIRFNVRQIYRVGLIQPGSVTVYEYYAPENRCTKFYHVEEKSKLLGTVCHSDVCRCAEENCFLKQQLEGQIDAAWRYDRACGPGVNYVFKAHLEEIQKNDAYDVYVMKIILVIKEGTEENVLNKKNNFISHIKCRKALDLKEGRDYLIWGVDGDVWKLRSGYSYVIGKDTWIEWWPNDRECQTEENRRQCDDLLDLSENLELNGCPL